MHSGLVGNGRQFTNLALLLLSRQIVARGLLDVLREFSDNENDFISVMETVARMSEDGGRCISIFLFSNLPTYLFFLLDIIKPFHGLISTSKYINLAAL